LITDTRIHGLYILAAIIVILTNADIHKSIWNLYQQQWKSN